MQTFCLSGTGIFSIAAKCCYTDLCLSIYRITIQSLADSIQGMMGVSSVNVNKFNKTVGGRM